MTSHLHQIGDVVSLNFDDGQFFSRLDPFTIEAQMPQVGTRLQYRIKSRLEAFCRVVPEHQLTGFGAEPSTLPVIILGSSKSHDIVGRKG